MKPMKPHRAEIVIPENGLPFSQWFARNVNLSEAFQRRTLTLFVILKKLERRGYLGEPGQYRIDFTSTRSFKLFKIPTD